MKLLLEALALRCIRNGLAGLAFTAAVPACQPSASPVAKAAAESETAVPVPPAGRPKTASRPDSLTPATQTLLQAHDLAPLWANRTNNRNQHFAMEGFYGEPPYRISFYFTTVVRDAAQPALFHVTGMNRYKKVITPFTGTITVRTVRPFTTEMSADIPDSTARAFTAAGQFDLREDPATKGAGRYVGEALLDFYVEANGHTGQAMDMVGQRNPTKGCGLLFRGTQVSNATGRRQPVAFANFYGAVVPQALQKLGDRSEEVNPNLAKLGWNEAWENDEWWADSPKPSLNL